MQRQQTSAVNEVIASILIVALVIALAVIIGGIVFGLIVIQPKSAYIPPEVKVVSYTNGTPQAISLYSRGGDTAYLDKGDNVQYALGVYVDRSEGSFRAKVEDDAGTFNPGQTLYVYWDNPVYRITDNLGSIGSVLPNGQLTLRIVDENAKLLVYNQGMTISGGGTVSPTPTCTLGTAWKIRNKEDVAFQYTLTEESSATIISQGVINPKTVLHIWHSKLPSYKAILTWNSTPLGNDEKNNNQNWCYFMQYITVFPGGGQSKSLQLLPGD